MPTVAEFLRAKLDETVDSLNQLVDQRKQLNIGKDTDWHQQQVLNGQIRPLRRRKKELEKLLQHHK